MNKNATKKWYNGIKRKRPKKTSPPNASKRMKTKTKKSKLVLYYLPLSFFLPPLSSGCLCRTGILGIV